MGYREQCFEDGFARRQTADAESLLLFLRLLAYVACAYARMYFCCFAQAPITAI